MSSFNGSGFSASNIKDLADFLHTRWERAPGTDIDPVDFYNNIIFSLITGPVIPTDHDDVLKLPLEQFSALNRLPQTIDGFVQAIATFWHISNTAALRAILLDPFKTSTGLINVDNALLSDLSSQMGVSLTQLQDDIAERAFNEFLKQFTYNTTNPTAPVELLDFQKQIKDYLVNFATLSAGVPLSPSSNPTYAGQDSINFNDIYNAFFQNDPDAFRQYLADFIKSIVYPTGGSTSTFLSSHEVGDWLTKIQQEYSKAISGSAAPTTSSVGESFKQVAILDRIYRLLTEMIGIIQQTAAAQSDRLRILTSWQSAYTKLQQDIHIFSVNDGSFISQDNNDSATSRGNLNSLNQTFTENIRSRRQIVQDEAKGLQTSINQSNDAATQQANIATAIIQELSTILGAIYR